MKYFVLEVRDSDLGDHETTKEMLFTFPEALVHCQFAGVVIRGLLRMRPRGHLRVVQAVSAGFVGKSGCYGESESMELKSRPIDNILLRG